MSPKERIDRVIRNILRRSRIIIAVCLILSLFAVLQLRKLEFDSSISIWYKPDDKIMQDYALFKEYFGSDAYIQVIYRNDSLFTSNEITLNRDLTQELQKLPNIEDAISLTSIKLPVIIFPKPLIREFISPDLPNLEKRKKIITSQPLFIDNVISKDGNATGITLILQDPSPPGSYETLHIVDSILHLERYHSNSYYLIGNIVISSSMNELVRNESQRFLAFALVLFFLIILLKFRNIIISLFPVLTALVAVVWTLALLALTGNSMNMVSSLMPLIVFIVSLSTSIHIMTGVSRGISENKPLQDSIIQAVTRVMIPCFFSCLTTSVAFLSFTAAPLAPVRIFGLFTSMGILFTFLLNFSLLPVLILYSRHRSWMKSWSRSPEQRYIFSTLVTQVTRRKYAIFLAAFIIGLFSILGITKLKVQTDQIQHFKKNHPVRISVQHAINWFDGIFPVEAMLVSDSLDPAAMFKTIEKIESGLRDIEGVIIWHSPLVYLNGMSSLLNENDRSLLMSYAFSDRLSQSENPFRHYLASLGKIARISIKTDWMNIEKMGIILDEIENVLSAGIPDQHFRTIVTGIIPLYYDISARLTKSQIRSILISFLLVFLILILLFRKMYFGLIGMIPNLFPVVFTLGIMGWTGIPIDVATVLIAAISLGITVDDTIHFLFVYRDLKDTSDDRPGIIRQVFDRIGLPISLTTLTICSGFLVLVLSSYIPLIYFGVFVSINIFIGLICDLLLLPALILFKKSGTDNN